MDIIEKTIRKKTTTHKLIQGDALEVLDKLPKGNIDLVFADPPYNIGKKFGPNSKKGSKRDYINWCKKWMSKIHELLADNGSFYLMAATQYMPFLDLYVQKKFTILNHIVWYYDSSGVQAKTKFGSLYEPILLCVKDENDYTFNYGEITVSARTGAVRELIDYRKEPPQPYSKERNPGNAWYFPRVRYRMPEYINHPAQKPELLLERIILASSNIDDTILDPFAGTFTTNAVAAKLGRNSIGIEIGPEYFQKGFRRIESTSEGDPIANKENIEKIEDQ